MKSLNERGVRVFGIGDTPYWNLNDELKNNLYEYCYVTDLSRLDWMKDTINYLQSKYGRMDFIESNNEFWLNNDAELRKYVNTDTGMWPEDMEKIKYKSKMKEYFIKAGVKVARYHLVSSFEESLEFVKKVDYPVFAKPDNGVGAADTYKISNEDELRYFHDTYPKHVPYIMEEYLDGYLISYDGICNLEGDVVLAFMETFPKPIAEVVKEDEDVYYYASLDMPEKHRKNGEAIVKSFGISKRCFHIEFFVLKNDKKGLGKKGDFIALEVNMRSPGGNTPDLLSIALGDSYYDVYADVITTNTTSKNISVNSTIAIAVSRKDRFWYKHSHDEIYQYYHMHILEHGHYPPEFARAMGNHFYFAKFETLEKALEFQKFVQDRF